VNYVTGTFHGPITATAPGSTVQASPSDIFLGGGALLSWAGCSGVFAIDGKGPVAGGSVRVSPAATTTYHWSDGTGATGACTVSVRPFTLKDLPGLAKAWGSARGDAAFDDTYDLNGDGKVDDLDVALCLKN